MQWTLQLVGTSLTGELFSSGGSTTAHIIFFISRCIRGLLSESSVVLLVTHQLQYVQQCDTVLGLNEVRLR